MDHSTSLTLSSPLTDTLNGEPAARLQPGIPLRIDATDWTAGTVLNALVCQQGPNHSRMELRWFAHGQEDPRMVITMGFLPEVTASLMYDMSYLDGNTLFLPRTPGRLKSTSLGQRMNRNEISHAELLLVELGTDQSLLLTQPVLSDETPSPHLPNRPLLDTFGQLTTRTWPGKHSPETPLQAPEFPAPPAETHEEAPELEATGWFRVHRDEDKRFHLVDPAGRRFFSAGVDCVNAGNSAHIIPGDEGYLPPGWESDELLSRHMTQTDTHRAVNFGTANLERVFGADWKTAWEHLTTARLRTWGFNTIANWSDKDYAKRSGLPFVLHLNHYPDTDLHLFRDFPDVYDPAFEQRASAYAEQLLPWRDVQMLIGYFMVNEPKWGFGTFNIASEMLEDHPGSHSRHALSAWVREKFAGDVNAWRAAWGLDQDHMDFEDLVTTRYHRLAESHPEAEKDLFEFSRILVRRFVQIPAAALREVDPHHLNLGMRWAWISSDLCYESATVSDVFSLNCYGMEPDLDPSDEVAKRFGIPTMIGEYHFGALDRGLTGTGLRGVATQADRGAAYRRYLEVCAADPNLVGCHYFQYNDQSAVGRFDGECWNIGLVDVCNRPYTEMVEAAALSHARLKGLTMGTLEPVPATAVEVGKVAF